LIELLGAAPLVDDMPVIGDAMQSVAASIHEGAQLVIARGNGLVGGPRCGIIVGTRTLVHRIETHPMFAAWRVDPLTAALLHATLQLYGDRHEMRQTIPLYQLLSTSVENLRQRAERLAPQLAQAADVEIAEAVAIDADDCLGIAGCASQRLASYGVSLVATGGDVQALDRRLLAAPIPVVGRRQDDRLVLDLRTVFPRQDQRLVEMIVGHAPAEAGASAPPGSSD
jgi:L-seryl-tRNA(Ser) seleniumtransferase